MFNLIESKHNILHQYVQFYTSKIFPCLTEIHDSVSVNRSKVITWSLLGICL